MSWLVQTSFQNRYDFLMCFKKEKNNVLKSYKISQVCSNLHEIEWEGIKTQF